MEDWLMLKIILNKNVNKMWQNYYINHDPSLIEWQNF